MCLGGWERYWSLEICTRRRLENYKPLSFCMDSDDMALESFPVAEVEFLTRNDT